MSDKPFKPFIEYDELTGQPRLITGVTDGNVRDPNAPVNEPLGKTYNIGKLDDLPVHSRYCPNADHNLVPDETETDFEALKCTKCPYGVLVKPKTIIEEGVLQNG